MMEYRFRDIEKKWQTFFAEKKSFTFVDDEKKEKFYCLEMFPYPSGRLHLGHVRNYAIGDVLSRLKRLQGYAVLHPIGWDAFGLPAENAAIANHSHPAKWTFANIDEMREQLKKLGLSYDYDNEVCTASKEYYRWGQWIFKKLHDAGLVYRKNAWVNWDPVDKTVLANEQVGEGGIAWRSGAVVEKKQIEQWYFKITDYGEELHAKLDELTGWSESVKNMQRNWIGRSEGALVRFQRVVSPVEGISAQQDMPVEFPIFTTRPDTIYDVTFMAISFDHEELEQWITLPPAEKTKVLQFAKECRDIDQKENYEKKGMDTGTQIYHPLTGEKLPLYVANFVLAEYGTGAIMGVPSDDERDRAFAIAHGIALTPAKESPAKADLKGKSQSQAIAEVIARLEKAGVGKKQITYKLRDWLISRQRYWGNPIPVLWDADEYRLVDEKDLPVSLPQDFDFTATPTPLQTLKDFTQVSLNGKTLRRESDTMDTFTCSSWYFMRYFDVANTKAPFSIKKAGRWLPVDQYIGGIEHACLHLLYSRFIHKALRDIGLLTTDEPFSNLLSQGMVLAKSYFSPEKRRYYFPEELGKNKDLCPETGAKLIVKVEAMSKSKNNGVDPDRMITEYGADSLRLAMLFTAPVERDIEWNERVVEGCQRLIMRVVRIAEAMQAWKFTDKEVGHLGATSWHDVFLSEEAKPINAVSQTTATILRAINILIDKVENDVSRQHYNTPVAAMMTFVNATYAIPNEKLTPVEKSVMLGAFSRFIVAFSLYAPHISEELSQQLAFSGTIFPNCVFDATWPSVEKKYLVDEEATIAVQVNGKLRSTLVVGKGTDKKTLVQMARANKNVSRWLENKTVIKEIVVPEKIVNIVIK